MEERAKVELQLHSPESVWDATDVKKDHRQIWTDEVKEAIAPWGHTHIREPTEEGSGGKN